jgi:L-amino acid N-acyltransferase YncA
MIRRARAEDARACIMIMNEAILKGKNAYSEQLDAESGRAWFDHLHQNAEVLLCYEYEGIVVAWGTLTAYRKGRAALEGVSEITFYVASDFHRKGIASSLIKALEKYAVEIGKTNLIAILLDDNQASKSLLAKHIYEHWGHLPAIADFDGVIKGQFYLGKNLK